MEALKQTLLEKTLSNPKATGICSRDRKTRNQNHPLIRIRGKRQIWISAVLALAIVIWQPAAWASWTQLDSKTTRTLQDVQFPVDANTGYVVGAQGTILRTTDGGASWKSVPSRTNENLLAVHFPLDNTTGYVVGTGGTILKTTNGGSKWVKQDSGTTLNLRTVHFPVDALTGYAAGNTGIILKTTDGGSNWNPVTPVEVSVFDIHFPVDNNTGYAVGTWGTIGEIYKTTDGGSTWTRQVWIEDEILKSVQFPTDATTGYALGRLDFPGRIYKTTDGGASWSLQDYGATEMLSDLHFPVDASTGFAVGDIGASFKTTDGAANWVEGGTGPLDTLNAVYFVDNTTGYAVGGNGVIVKTADGGGGNSFTVFLHPSANGTVNGFTDVVGCQQRWDCVNDQPFNAGTGIPQPPTTADYLADASGNRQMFALDDGVIGPGYRITAIKVGATTFQWGGPYISLGYQRIGIDPAPVDTVPFWAGSYYFYETFTHLWTGLDWTPADLDALEIGLKHESGPAVEAAQAWVKVFYEPIQ